MNVSSHHQSCGICVLSWTWIIKLDKTGFLQRGIDEEGPILLEGENSDLPEMEINLPASVVHLGEAGNIVLAGSDFLMMQVKEKQFKVSAESFFQVNTSMTEKMVDHVLTLLPKEKLNCLVDLYCGVGLFSAFTADLASRLIGIEFNHSACMDYERIWMNMIILSYMKVQRIQSCQGWISLQTLSLQIHPGLGLGATRLMLSSNVNLIE